MNIGELTAIIEGYLYDRTDLGDKIPNFIDMAQRKIFRSLQCRENEQQHTAQISGNEYPLQADLQSLRYLLVNDRPLESISEVELRRRLKVLPAQGEPTAYCRIQDSFVFHPSADSDYPVHVYYYADLSSDISDDAATNAVMTAYPDLYLWGALMVAAPYLNEDDRIGTWKGLYDEALMSISEKVVDEMYSGANLTVSSAY